MFFISVLRRIHLFFASFAVSAGCLLLAGMIAGYDGQRDFEVSAQLGALPAER